MSIQLTNPFAFLEFRSPQPSDELQSQFYEIPAVKPSPLFQSLQDETQKSAEEAAKGTVCADCSKTTSRRWCTNPQDPTSKICEACYNRIHRKKKAAEEAAKGTTCVDCSRTATIQWYTNPQDPMSKICNACYNRIHREKKAAEQAAKEATLLPVPSRTIASPNPKYKRKKTSEGQISQKRVKQSTPISHPGFQINPPPFFEPPHALDEECFSLFSSVPGQSLEESGLPDSENEQANYPVNDPHDFLLEDSLLYETHE